MNNYYSQNKSFLAYPDGKTKTANPPYRTEIEKKKNPFDVMADISKNITEGARIKQNVGDYLIKNYPSGNYKGIFDGIDEKTVEKNIPIAENVIKQNTQNGAFKLSSPQNLPYLRDGLALFYASAEQGDNKAANVARTAALPRLKSRNNLKTSKLQSRKLLPTFSGRL